MKLYINKNCNGYHWYECMLPDYVQFDGGAKVLRMERSSDISEDAPLIRGLRTSSQYTYCLAKDNTKYLLALNNMPETKRTDNYGRPIKFTLIFVSSTKTERLLLFKMLLDRIGNYTHFYKQMDECFISDINSNPSCVLYRWHKLSEYLQTLNKRKIAPWVTEMLPKSTSRLLVASPDSTNTMKELGFRNSEINEAVCMFSATNSNLLSEPEEKEIAPTLDITKDATQSGKNEDGEVVLPCEDHSTNLHKMEEEKKQLSDKLEISTKRHECEREELNGVISGLKKKVRYLNGIIAVLSGIIIILIIVNLLK